jgi:hypothetical protein
MVENVKGKGTRLRNVYSNNVITMKGVTPSWGGDDATGGRPGVLAFEDETEFYWEFQAGTGAQSDAYLIMTVREWTGGAAGLPKAVLSIQTVIEHGNTAAFMGTVQCRNDLDGNQRTWGAQFWVFYPF